MRRLKNRIELLSLVLLTTIVLTIVPTVSASTTDTQKVAFGCHATGGGFVIWNIWDFPGVDAYLEPAATGSVTCVGAARVEEDGGWPWPVWPYVAEAGSVCCIGSLVARWIHGGKDHKLCVVFHSTEETVGFFWPEANYFMVGMWDIPTMMEFKGILIEDDGSQRISGRAGVGVLSHQYDYTPPEACTITVLLWIDLGEDLAPSERWLPVNVAWVDRDVTLPYPAPQGTPIEAAEVFLYTVELLGS